MWSPKKSEIRLEFRRKMTHMTVGALMLALVWAFEPVFGKMVILPLLFGVFLLLAVQLFGDCPINRFLVGKFERKKDAKIKYQGAILYGVGISVPLLLLEIGPAAAIIAILTFGDTASTLIGKLYGRHKVGKKSLEGFFAFVLVSVPASWIFLQSLPLAAGLSLAGAIIEFFTPIDDNLAIPGVLTAIVLLI
ncbi:MAG: diacylglycerol/polyprenol kinase family protein [Candidatus Aenigmatarchaeota archaeon]